MDEDGLSLLEQSLLWLLPYALLMLLMVHAMMEFTISLLVQRPPAGGVPGHFWPGCYADFQPFGAVSNVNRLDQSPGDQRLE